MVLLDIPLVSVLGIIITIGIALMGFLLKDAYNKLVERVKDLEQDRIRLQDKVIATDTRVDREMRAIDNRMSDLKLNILEKLENIKEKFDAVRK